MPNFGQFVGLGVVVLALAVAEAAWAAESDPRDYEALTALPNRTAAAVIYYRHVSSNDTQSFSEDIALLRAAYELRFGHWSVVPMDMALPVVDVTAYVPAMPLSPANVALRASGIGDFLYFPTVGYLIPQDPINHTYVAFTPFFSFPTGDYVASHPLNTGANRYLFIQQFAVGQRFLKIADAEAVFDITEYTDNTNFQTTAMGALLTGHLAQKPTYNLTLHASADVAPVLWLAISYFMTVNGQINFTNSMLGIDTKVEGQQFVHTLRFSGAIRVEKGTLLLLQYSQDVATTGGASISRYFGGRISHIW